MAILAVVLGPLILVYFGSSSAANSEEDQFNLPMTFALEGNGGNCDSCQWTSAVGVITEDTPDAFREYLKPTGTHTPSGHVVFHSPGGNIDAAIELGRLIREQKFTTDVGSTQKVQGHWSSEVFSGRCESACTLSLMGGVVRGFSGSGDEQHERLVGFHEIRNADFEVQSLDDETARLLSARGFSVAQAVVGKIVQYQRDMGVDARAINLGIGFERDRLNYPTMEELFDLQIFNVAIQKDGKMTIDHHRGGIIARKFTSDALQEREVYFYCDGPSKTARFTFRSNSKDSRARMATDLQLTKGPPGIGGFANWTNIELDDLDAMYLGMQVVSGHQFFHFEPSRNFWNSLIRGEEVDLLFGMRSHPGVKVVVSQSERALIDLAFKNCLTGAVDVVGLFELAADR